MIDSPEKDPLLGDGLSADSSHSTPDPPGGIDIASLRLSQDFEQAANVKKALLTVPVRKPHRQSFVRVRPGEAWRLQTAVLEFEEERETYLVDASLWPELAGEIVPKVLFTAIDRQAVVFLWPVRLPGNDGRSSPWARSAMDAAELAQNRWISVRANMALGAYDVYEAAASLPEPEWPDVSFEKLVEIAFRDRFIRSTDHAVVQRILGAK